MLEFDVCVCRLLSNHCRNRELSLVGTLTDANCPNTEGIIICCVDKNGNCSRLRWVSSKNVQSKVHICGGVYSHVAVGCSNIETCCRGLAFELSWVVTTSVASQWVDQRDAEGTTWP